MTEHTLGPWTQRDAPYGYDIFVSDLPTDRALWIASITTGLVGKDTPFYPPREACAANALLISAAPDLANAAMRAWRALSWIIAYDSKDKTLAGAMAELEAAIGKAGTFDFLGMRAKVEADRQTLESAIHA